MHFFSIMSKKKILLYQGGRYSLLQLTYKYFKSILNDYIVDMVDDVEIFQQNEFFNYDTTIFFSQDGVLTETQEKNILEFVASGKGFIGLHGASASFKPHIKYFEMLGGKFVSHKRIQDIDIRFVDNIHPITQGLENFIFRDEPYRHDFSMGKDLHILAEAHYHDIDDPKPEPIMWVKFYDQGRVFFCALGHKPNSLKSTIFQTILKRAVKWVLQG